MPFDPKDVDQQKAIKDAVDAALAEAQEEHETAVAGLKTKNKELLGKLAKANTGDGDPQEIARLETELEKTQKDLKQAQKDLKTVTTDRDTLKTTADDATKFANNQFLDGDLTTALSANKIDAKFLPAVKAMLAGKATVAVDGANRKAMVGDKPLSEFVKEWSLGDEGKVYVNAAGNGGGGAGGSGGQGASGGKTLSRDAYEAMPHGERNAFFSSGGTIE